MCQIKVEKQSLRQLHNHSPLMQDIEIKWINNDNIKPPHHRGIVTFALGTSSEYTTPLSQTWDTLYICNVQYTTKVDLLQTLFLLWRLKWFPQGIRVVKNVPTLKGFNNRNTKLRVRF